ncbi:RES family NAD+ phosphorylase [Saccharopolyspora spinosporotrichia]
MPDLAPPPKYADSPARHELPADAELWRVHSGEFDATSFRPGPSDDHFGGGRFDGTERDPYPVYYAALQPPTALMEYLARDLRYRDNGGRLVSRGKVNGRRISSVRTTRPLALVSLLSGPDLAAVAQDGWLIQSDEYGKTRRWASWIREQARWADGLIWRSRRDIGERRSFSSATGAAPTPWNPRRRSSSAPSKARTTSTTCSAPTACRSRCPRAGKRRADHEVPGVSSQANRFSSVSATSARATSASTPNRTQRWAR